MVEFCEEHIKPNISNHTKNHVRFISYTGVFPSLCMGTLTLEINGKEYIFNDPGEYYRFWESGGSCGFLNNYRDTYVNPAEWIIWESDLPTEFRKYVEEIDEVFNENVPYGCCGGCL